MANLTVTTVQRVDQQCGSRAAVGHEETCSPHLIALVEEVPQSEAGRSRGAAAMAQEPQAVLLRLPRRVLAGWLGAAPRSA